MENKTVKELRIIAKELGIKRYYRMRKAFLIEMIKIYSKKRKDKEEVKINSKYKVNEVIKDKTSKKYYEVADIFPHFYKLKDVNGETRFFKKEDIEGSNFISFEEEKKTLYTNDDIELAISNDSIIKDIIDNEKFKVVSKDKFKTILVNLRNGAIHSYSNRSVESFIYNGRFKVL